MFDCVTHPPGLSTPHPALLLSLALPVHTHASLSLFPSRYTCCAYTLCPGRLVVVYSHSIRSLPPTVPCFTGVICTIYVPLSCFFFFFVCFPFPFPFFSGDIITILFPLSCFFSFFFFLVWFTCPLHIWLLQLFVYRCCPPLRVLCFF